MAGRAEIEQKLRELVADYDETLLEYVLVLLDNPEKDANELIVDLEDFLGPENARNFVRWTGRGNAQEEAAGSGSDDSFEVVVDNQMEAERMEFVAEEDTTGDRAVGEEGERRQRLVSVALKDALSSQKGEASVRRAKKQQARLRQAEEKERLRASTTSATGEGELSLGGAGEDLRDILKRSRSKPGKENTFSRRVTIMKRGEVRANRHSTRRENDLRSTLLAARRKRAGSHKRGGGPMPIAAPPGFAIVPISTLSTMSQPALANTQPNLPYRGPRGGRGGFRGRGGPPPFTARGGMGRGRGSFPGGRGIPITPVPKSARQWINPNLMEKE